VSAIRLNNGMVLYLREVSEYLALVCIIRDEYFARRALLDYNIDCLKTSLAKVINVTHDTNNNIINNNNNNDGASIRSKNG
jgi:Ras-related GTP-binding protein C/D